MESNNGQFPLQVAYAMTIDKSQGQTMHKVGLYFPSPVFTHGQLYVAFSRCSSFRNVSVFINHKPTKEHTANIVFQEVLE